eukprot:s1427_g3.t1
MSVIGYKFSRRFPNGKQTATLVARVEGYRSCGWAFRLRDESRQSELTRAEARAIIEGKLGREKEPQGAVLVDDLKDALSGFFSAIGTRVTLAVAPGEVGQTMPAVDTSRGKTVAGD